jgi:hypothetical protein
MPSTGQQGFADLLAGSHMLSALKEGLGLRLGELGPQARFRHEAEPPLGDCQLASQRLLNQKVESLALCDIL